MIIVTKIEVIRATQEWQQAGAYYVRIQGMDRKYHIPLREEFDEHDGGKSRYIVLTEDGYSFATCRFYELDENSVMIGRVVVLPEYRGRNFGSKVIKEAEKWIRESGYTDIYLDSRLVAIGFYEKLGYRLTDDNIIFSSRFECKRMHKQLKKSA